MRRRERGGTVAVRPTFRFAFYSDCRRDKYGHDSKDRMCVNVGVLHFDVVYADLSFAHQLQFGHSPQNDNISKRRFILRRPVSRLKWDFVCP